MYFFYKNFKLTTYLLIFNLIIYLGMSAAHAQTEDTNQLLYLWKIQHEKAQVYLYGSIHVGEPSMFPLPKKVEDAYNASDYLVLEINEAEKK